MSNSLWRVAGTALFPLIVCCEIACARVYSDALGADGGASISDGRPETSRYADGKRDSSKPAAGVEPLYPLHASWNAYIARTYPDRPLFEQPDVDCDPSTLLPSACAHAGELRQFALAGRKSCAGISAADDLDAFHWTCVARKDGVFVVSTGLKVDKGLSDLVSPTGAFLPNAVTAYQDGGVIEKSLPSVWWTNPVKPLARNDQPTDRVHTLNEAGTIYILPASRTSQGYNINADGIAVVTLGKASLSLQNGAPSNCNLTNGEALPAVAGEAYRPCLLAAGRQRHLWIEASLGSYPNAVDVRDLSTAIALYDVVHSTIRRARIDSGGYGIIIRNSRALRLEQVHVANVYSYATIVGASKGIFVSDYVAQNYGGGSEGSAGLMIEQEATGSVFTRLLMANYEHYAVLMILNASFSTVSHLTAVNGGYSGIALQSGTSYMTLAQAVVANVGGPAFTLRSAASNKLCNIVAAHSGEGVRVGEESPNNNFSQRLSTGHNGADCVTSACSNCAGTNLTGQDGTCGTSDGSVALLGPVDLSAAFRGHVSADASNTSDVAGKSECSALDDWTGFDFRGRTWSLGGDAPLLDESVRGRCFADNPRVPEPCSCRIADWRLSLEDDQLRDSSDPSGSGNDPFRAGSTCPKAVHGDLALSDALGNTFLVNATERLRDAIGDDDGLCESGETCLYSPNLGYDQGDPRAGALGPCVFVGGIVREVTLYALSDD